MLATIRYLQGLGNLAVFVRLRDVGGNYWDWSAAAWVDTENVNCRQALNEYDDSDPDFSRYSLNVAAPTSDLVVEYVLGSSGEVLGDEERIFGSATGGPEAAPAPSGLTITKDAVLLIAGELAGKLTDPEWAAVLEDTGLEVNLAAYSTPAKANAAAKWLAAHKAWSRARSKTSGGGSAPAGPLQSVTVGPVSKTFAAPQLPTGSSSDELRASSYGREYLRLVRLWCPRALVV